MRRGKIKQKLRRLGLNAQCVAQGLNGGLVIPVQQIRFGLLPQEIGIFRMLFKTFFNRGLGFKQCARTAHLRLFLAALHADRAVSCARNAQLHGALLRVGLRKKAFGRA